MKNKNLINTILYKSWGYFLLIVSFSVYVHESIKTPLPFHENSLKAKAHNINNYIWGVIFFCFAVVIMISSTDTFIFSRPLTVKYLTRTALGLIVVVTIVDSVVSLIKDSNKSPIKK